MPPLVNTISAGSAPISCAIDAARLVEQRLGALPEVMDARRVAEILGERARHRLDDRGVGRGGGVVVEVDAGTSVIRTIRL